MAPTTGGVGDSRGESRGAYSPNPESSFFSKGVIAQATSFEDW